MPKKGDRKWHALLLPHPQIQSWYDNMARRDQTTADESLRRLGRNVHDALGKDPVHLLGLDQQALEDAANACITHMFKRGLKGCTVQGFYVTLTGFLAWNRRKLERKIAIPGADEYEGAESETIPGPDGLRSVLAACSLRTRASLLVIAHGGQRPEVLGLEDARLGLRLGDLVDLVLGGPEGVSFRKVPCKIDVGKQLSKNGKRYFFFLGPEACEAILAYLRQRLRDGEALSPEGPLFRPNGGKPRFMTRAGICNNIKQAMQRAGHQGRPYVWRCYFAHHAEQAESKGLLASWRKFFMGHKGGIQTRYANRKVGLPAESIEEMRQAYAKALPRLETVAQKTEDPTLQTTQLILEAAGFTAKEIAALDVEAKPTEELGSLLREALQARQKAQQAPVPLVQAARQRVVAAGELESALAQGWLWKATLPDGRLLMETTAPMAA
jgi:integrase